MCWGAVQVGELGAARTQACLEFCLALAPYLYSALNLHHTKRDGKTRCRSSRVSRKATGLTRREEQQWRPLLRGT